MFKRIFNILLIIAVSFSLVGCGAKETPEEAVTNALNALKEFDREKVEKYMNYDSIMMTVGDSTDIDTTNKILLKNMSFNIVSSEVKGRNATVKTEIKNVNMGDVFNDYLARSISNSLSISVGPENEETTEISESDASQESAKLLEQIVDEKKDDQSKRVVILNLTRQKDSWNIEVSKDLQNAVFGGLLAAMQ